MGAAQICAGGAVLVAVAYWCVCSHHCVSLVCAISYSQRVGAIHSSLIKRRDTRARLHTGRCRKPLGRRKNLWQGEGIHSSLRPTSSLLPPNAAALVGCQRIRGATSRQDAPLLRRRHATAPSTSGDQRALPTSPDSTRSCGRRSGTSCVAAAGDAIAIYLLRRRRRNKTRSSSFCLLQDSSSAVGCARG